MKKELREKAISEMLEKGELCVCELERVIDGGKSSALSLLRELCKEGILEKKVRRYTLSPRLAVYILSVRKDSAELVEITLGRVISRRDLPFSLSKSFGENIELLSETVMSHVKFMRNEFDVVRTGLIYDGKQTLPSSVYERFDIVEKREELLAETLSEFCSGSVLYLSVPRGISLLCRDGKAFSPVCELSGDIASALSSMLLLVSPEALLLGGEDKTEFCAVREICEKNAVKLLFAKEERLDKLFADEMKVVSKML